MAYPVLAGSVSVEPRPEHQVSLVVTIPVEIVDISLSGVLLASNLELRVGDRVQLTAAIGSRALRLQVEIRRVSIGSKSQEGSARYYAGATFSGSSAEHRAMLAQLLRTR
jgi:hypothetical protein